MAVLGWLDTNRVLRPQAAAVSARRTAASVAVFGAAYGAAMGSFRWTAGGSHWPLQIAYAAVKTPLLMLGALAVTLPALFVLNSLLGLRADLRESLRALVTTQAAVAVSLAALAPLTLLCYASTDDYNTALVANGAAFAVATLAGQVVLRSRYRPLVRRNPRHRVLLRAWVVAYALVAIQLAWLLRPFLGAPTQPITFFRSGAWDNAYVTVARIVWRAVSGE